MATAAYEAIPVVLEYFGERVGADLVELGLTLAVAKQGRPFIPILRSAASILKAEQSYDRLRKLLLVIVLDSNCVSSVIGRILKTDVNRALALYAPAIVSRVVAEFVANKVQAESAVALLCIIMSHSPEIIGLATDLLLQLDFCHNEFVFSVLRIALPNARSDIPLAAISRFCITHFKRGGMLLVGSLLLSHAELGLALLSRGVAKAAFLLCANDLPNARAYLRFVQVALAAAENFGVAGSFAAAALRLALEVIRTFGSDPQIGHQIISLSVQIVWKVKEIIGEDAFRREFAQMATIAGVMAMLRLQIGKAAIRQRNANLIAFSSTGRSKRVEDEWEELAVGSDGD
jgi:hypothetical protein